MNRLQGVLERDEGAAVMNRLCKAATTVVALQQRAGS